MIALKYAITSYCRNWTVSHVVSNTASFAGGNVGFSQVLNRSVKTVASSPNFGSSNQVSIDVSPEDTGTETALKRIAAQYPQPHGSLNNIMATVTRELKSPGKKLDISFKAVGSKTITAWTCHCHLNWPSTISFSAVAKTKQEASRMASLKVLHWLNLQGKIKGNKPILVDGKVISNLKKTNVQLLLYEPAVAKLKEVLSAYEPDVKEMIDNRVKESGDKMTVNEGRIYDAQIPETQRVRMVNARNKLLKERLLHRSSDENVADIMEKQEELPIFKFRESILQTVRRNQVVVIKGEPGCGKSTQVPQYILDEAARVGSACDVNIIVTQPRRISAISLAERVAKERGEQVGDSIGYQVRFKSRNPKPTGGSIRFCSSGILLRTLQSNPRLNGVSHVILDEAHERDVNTDMLMLLLKRVLAANPKLKLVVMSATINPELFQNYYAQAEALSIPGFTFPVKSYYLEEINGVNLSQTKSAQDQKTPRLFHNEIADVIKWIDKTKPPGAVLCFLPGWQDIKLVMGHLQRTLDHATSVILPLHSRLTFDEQSQVFRNHPEGIRKVILSTNVAETSVTIDDVVYVVDSGVHKEERLSADKGSAVLDDDWVSQANVSQRRGRAGRVQPGESFHLYTRARFNDFPVFPVPELHRVPLQKVVLDLKTYNEEESAAEFLSGMPEPPSLEATRCAVDELVQLGALTPEETLTSLGRRIAKFSTSPRLSKALVHAVIFRCLNPMLTISSILSADADLFSNSLEERAEIAALKKSYSPFSDHYATLAIYEEWNNIYQARQSDEMFCIRNMLRGNTLRLISRIRQLTVEQLVESNMLSAVDAEESKETDLPTSPEFVKAVLLSGTLSFLFRRNWDFKNGRIRVNAPSMITESGSKASLASDCVCHKQSNLPTPFLTYFRRQESSVRRATIIRDASTVSPLALALFLPKSQGRALSSTAEMTVIDDRRNSPYRLLASSRDAELIYKLQQVIDDVTTYFLDVEGTHRDDNYQRISQYRDSLVLALSELVHKSTHTTHYNEEVLQSG